MSSTSVPLLAVTGHPVLHSKSPLMFNAVFQQQWQLFTQPPVYCRLAASSAKEAIYLFKQLGLKGMNVTAPFKYDIIDYLDLIDVPAARIGGINTVVQQDNGLIGYNTDFTGVVNSLIQRKIKTQDLKCIVLGAGGAGRAAAYGLVREGADVIIVNRNYSKAAEAAKTFGCRVESIDTLENLLKSTQLLVSTLSADIDIINQSWLRKDLLVFDANYKSSALSEKAILQGCTIIKGEEWLLNQAIPAFDYFTRIDPQPVTIATMKQSLSSPPMQKPDNIALVGFMASGKSIIGKLLAQKMGFQFKDTDLMIEAKEGLTVPEIFAQKGEAYFRAAETAVLKEELTDHRNRVYACGGGMVLADENKKHLKENTLVIWLYSSIQETLKRLQPGTRPLLDGDNPQQEAEQLLQKRLPQYAQSCHLIVNSEKPAQEVAEKIYEEIDKTFNH
jgi:shikimate dehydrogenase